MRTVILVKLYHIASGKEAFYIFADHIMVDTFKKRIIKKFGPLFCEVELETHEIIVNNTSTTETCELPDWECYL